MGKDKVTFSVRCSRDLMDRARDAVYTHQGPPLSLTLVALTADALLMQIRAVKRANAGKLRKVEWQRAPHEKDAPKREIHSVKVDAEIVKRSHVAHNMVSHRATFAAFFEAGMRSKLREIVKAYGPLLTRPTSPKGKERLRVGRRVR